MFNKLISGFFKSKNMTFVSKIDSNLKEINFCLCAYASQWHDEWL